MLNFYANFARHRQLEKGEVIHRFISAKRGEYKSEYERSRQSGK